MAPAADAPLEAWRAAVDAAAAQLEQQSNRQENLELLKKYGSAAWRAHNEQVGREKEYLAQQLAAQRQANDTLNRKRKAGQVAVAGDLQALQNGFYALAEKNRTIQRACDELQAQLDAQQPNKQQKS